MQTISSVKRFIDKREVDMEYLPNIGSGIFRTAYRYGDYVIKTRSNGNHSPRSRYVRTARAVGFELAPTTLYRGYAIQRYYTPIARWGRRYMEASGKYYRHVSRYGDTGMDFHSGNVAWNKRTKKLVLFDW